MVHSSSTHQGATERSFVSADAEILLTSTTANKQGVGAVGGPSVARLDTIPEGR